MCVWIRPAHFSAPGDDGLHHARGHACGRRGRLPPAEGAPHRRPSRRLHPPTGLLQRRSAAPAPPLGHVQEAVRERQREGLRRLAVWTRGWVSATLQGQALWDAVTAALQPCRPPTCSVCFVYSQRANHSDTYIVIVAICSHLQLHVLKQSLNPRKLHS